MDAISFILQEHRQIKKHFAEIKKSKYSDLRKRRMFHTLAQFLVRHETMEQKVWYSKLRTNAKLRTTIKHLISEEKTAAKAIKKLKQTKTQTSWDDKFNKLRQDVLHHATEEQTKLFPKVRKLVEKTELNKIGKALRQFKAKHKTGKRA